MGIKKSELIRSVPIQANCLYVIVAYERGCGMIGVRIYSQGKAQRFHVNLLMVNATSVLHPLT